MNRKTGVTGFLLGLFLGMVLLAGGLTGCGGKSGEGSGGGGGEPSTVTVAQLADLTGLNELLSPATPIHTGLLYYGLFLQLLEEQANYESGPAPMKPRLAESWEFSPDRKLLTFKLRPGMIWSDGQPITADDVAFTFEAQRAPEIGWHMAESKSRIDRVEVVDPLTVRFHFKEVYSTQLIDANEGVILPKHLWGQIPFSEWRARSTFFDQNIAYSGPFKVESWKPQERIVLVRNDKYFEPGVPKVDRVVVEVVPDEATQLSLLRSGKVDAIENVLPQNVAELKNHPQIDLLTHIPRTYFNIIWNTSRPLLSEKEVRQALTLAIDRQAIVDSLWAGRTKVPAGLQWDFYGDMFHADWKVPEYDPKIARDLLRQAGLRVAQIENLQ